LVSCEVEQNVSHIVSMFSSHLRTEREWLLDYEEAGRVVVVGTSFTMTSNSLQVHLVSEHPTTQ